MSFHLPEGKGPLDDLVTNLATGAIRNLTRVREGALEKYIGIHGGEPEDYTIVECRQHLEDRDGWVADTIKQHSEWEFIGYLPAFVPETAILVRNKKAEQ